MKFSLVFKTPDFFEQIPGGLKGDKAVISFVRKYTCYDEYITVEFDTDTGKVTVMES